MKSIFEIENRLNIQAEFEKMFTEFQTNNMAVNIKNVTTKW